MGRALARSHVGPRSPAIAESRADGSCLRAKPHAHAGRVADRPARARGPACAYARAQACIPVRSVILAGTRLLGLIVRPGACSWISRRGACSRAVADHGPASARILGGPRLSGRLARAADDRAASNEAVGDRDPGARRRRPRPPGVTDRRERPSRRRRHERSGRHRRRERPSRRRRPARRRVTSLASRSRQARIPPGSCDRVFGPASASDRRALRLSRLPRRPSGVRRPARIRRPAHLGHTRAPPCWHPARGARCTRPATLRRLAAPRDPLILR